MAAPTAPGLPDPDAARLALGRVFTEAWAAFHQLPAQAGRLGEPLPFDPSAQVAAAVKFQMALWSDPVRAANLQWDAWREWRALWDDTLRRLGGSAGEPAAVPVKADRRFSHSAWTDQPWFAHIKEAYLLANRQLTRLVEQVEDLDPDTRTRVQFMVRQYLDGMAPTNFAASNPEVLERTFETGGVNLLAGLANLLADVASGKGLVSRRARDSFELGVNLAATPGGVVLQTELFQLIQYAPTTKQVARRPLLYIPPLVNRYYLVDLQPKSSLLKWLVDAGFTVFTVSWVNPGPDLHDQDLASYVVDGVVRAMDAVADLTGEPVVDMAGFCMGGTLAAAAAAYLAGAGRGARLGALTLIGTLLDFSDLREWSTFAGDSDLKALDAHLAAKGYVSSEDLQKLFSLMRANDLIWSSVVSHYLLDREAPPSDILFWFADGARIPAAFLSTYGDQLLRRNLLREPGGVSLRGVGLDLGRVTAPVLVLSLKDDHVTAWEATYAGARLFGGPAQFMLGGSGHNAGVINPPSANKHGYWLNAELPERADAWLASAEKRNGSWWPTWQAWLASHDDETRPARTPGCGKAAVLEPAPGSFVRTR